MSEEEKKDQEKQAFVRLIHEIGELAKHASITGMLEGGEARCIRQYNAIVRKLQETQEIPEGLFELLEEGTSYGEIGVAASLLGAYLKEPQEGAYVDVFPPPPHARQARHRDRQRRAQEAQQHAQEVHELVQIRLKDAFEHAGKDLRDLGMLVRESMPETIVPDPRPKPQASAKAGPSADKRELVEEEKEPAGKEQDLVVQAEIHAEIRPELDQELHKLREQIDAIADQLREPGVSVERLQELAGTLATLTQRQTELLNRV